ncbi:T9SS type A sorting domain-containing protein [Flavobacterium sp. LS1R49]|uniref:T9SS type A sorting domain-containing protein n=1 Tax=Flavobacterium shii TaxID=2987687 RepID=A0A9X2ZF95_9FLAO|nr:T9SS type A sorting domain-containing protein [Flavobacterium shii]MCV9928320.1 T9SS type A sorting domain-containing protein [Flavobacterium shii]
MKYYLILILLGFAITTRAQKKITFEYDNAGNQTKRELCLTCTSKNADEVPKEIEALVEEDLLKFSPEDVVSYYPNPVREELYLKWQLVNDNYVSSLMVYNFNGQVLQTFSQSERNNTQTIPFQSYPSGTYLVVLLYNNGEQKTIKIIKQK